MPRRPSHTCTKLSWTAPPSVSRSCYLAESSRLHLPPQLVALTTTPDCRLQDAALEARVVALVLTAARVAEVHVEEVATAVGRPPHLRTPGGRAPSPGRGPARLSLPTEVGDIGAVLPPTHAAGRGARLHLPPDADVADDTATITTDVVAPVVTATAAEGAGVGQETEEATVEQCLRTAVSRPRQYRPP